MKKHFVSALRTFCASLVIVIGCSLVPANPAAGRDWQPQRTWVFVVGVLQWQHRDLFDSFPRENRRDAQLVDFFREQGVPQQQILFLEDKQATSRRVRTEFPAFLSQAGPGDLLFFYYTGHGYKSDDERRTFFATYDAGEDLEGWATDSIVRDIEKYFKGSRALLTADTCYSGDLAAQTQRVGRRVTYATLTSSSSSQESTENWTFTEMLLAGFRGESFADINNDGEVSLSELAADIRDDMSFAEGQRSTFATTGNFPTEMLLASAASKIDPLIARRVEVRSEGDWYKARIIDARGGSYRVHYFGFEDSDDEWVSLRQIRNLGSPEYGAGARIDAQWEGKQTPLKITKVEAGSQMTHHKRYDDRWDESVIPNQTRPRSNSNSDSRDWQ